jgi:hypothetical protein
MIRRVIGMICVAFAMLILTRGVVGYDEYAKCLDILYGAKCDEYPLAGPKCINPPEDSCTQTECFFCTERTNNNDYRYCILVPYSTMKCRLPHGTVTCSETKLRTNCRMHQAQCVCQKLDGTAVAETCIIKTCEG